MAIYMKIPDIKGNVSSKGFEKSIEVYSYTSSAQRTVAQKPGRMFNRNATSLKFSPILLHKPMDQSSPKLMQHMNKATVIPKIEFYHVVANLPQSNFLVNTFDNVIITSRQESCLQDEVLEEYTLYYTSHTSRYTLFDTNGKAQSSQTTGYDLIQATSL